MADLDAPEAVKLKARSIKLSGSPARIFAEIQNNLHKHYQGVLKLRGRLARYHQKAKDEEQPFQQIVNLVENVRRRQGIDANFNTADTLVQTRSSLQAHILLIRCDLLLIMDIMKLRQATTISAEVPPTASVNFSEARDVCQELANKAEQSHNYLQLAEARLLFIQFAALERQWPSDTTDSEQLLELGHIHVAIVHDLIEKHPGSTGPVRDELAGMELMLRGGTFYEPVSNEEMRAVVQAMARELRGTGHWYYCENRHPFTIGECGMPMEQARCPQCGAAIGGQHHEAVDGVTAARDIEENLRGMRI